eukprot:PhF_6_TR494/c0_g1_i1/m.247/K13703/ABHD11; abhydrolase domain-containing protein 11
MVKLSVATTVPKVASLAPPLFVMHGLLGWNRNWNTISQNIAQQSPRHVHALDLRNHGTSPHVAPFSLEEMVKDVHETVQNILGDSGHLPVLMGHSLGGIVLARYLQRYPNTVRAAVFVDVTPCPFHPKRLKEFVTWIDAMREVFTNKGNRRLEHTSDISESLSGIIPDPKVRGFLLTNLERDAKTHSFRWRPNLDIIKAGLVSGEAGWTTFETDTPVDTPTAFIFGGNSVYYKDPNRVTNIRSVFGDNMEKCVRQIIVPNAEHWPHAEQPQVFMKELTNILEELAGAASH